MLELLVEPVHAVDLVGVQDRVHEHTKRLVGQPWVVAGDSLLRIPGQVSLLLTDVGYVVERFTHLNSQSDMTSVRNAARFISWSATTVALSW